MNEAEGINILPAMEEWKQLTESGWQLVVEMSGGIGGPPTLVGFTARRDVPGGTIRVSVHKQNDRDTIQTLVRDLLHLCSGLKVTQ